MDVLVTSYYYCKVRILKDDDVRYNVIIVHVYRHARRRFSFNAGRPASALPGLAPAQLRTHGIVHIDIDIDIDIIGRPLIIDIVVQCHVLSISLAAVSIDMYSTLTQAYC